MGSEEAKGIDESKVPAQGQTPLRCGNTLEWIKTIAAIAALFVAINEFLLKDKAAEVARLENAHAFLAMGVDPSIYGSVAKAIELSNQPEKINSTGTESLKILTELTPMHEYLVTWSACIAMDLCERESSLAYLCPKLTGYESLAAVILPKVVQSYDHNQRNSEYSGILNECEARVKSR